MKNAYFKKITSPLLVCIVAISSCTLNPTIREGNVVITLGGSFATKSVEESATITRGVTTLSYSRKGKDETVLPRAMMWSSAAGAGASALNSVAKEAVKKIK